MSESIRPPDLAAVTSQFLEVRARFVVVGGFAVIGNRHVRATKDVDLMIPDSESNDQQCTVALQGLAGRRARDDVPITNGMLSDVDHLRALTRSGLVDLIREGESPLDFESIARNAHRADLGAGEFLVAGLAAVVGLKRLAGRPIDRQDLLALEAEHGELPILEIPGLDD